MNPSRGSTMLLLLTCCLLLLFRGCSEAASTSAGAEFSPCEESLQLCTCSPDLLVADCSGKGLRDPPKGLPVEMQELSLARNVLGSSRSNVSSSLHLGPLLSRLPNLMSLDLSGNRLAAVASGVHTELRSLDLSNNEISSVTWLKLEGLVSLSELNLSGNRLESLPRNSFPASLPLQRLSLRANRIESLEKGSLATLTELTELLLAKNRLTSLPKGIFHPLGQLRTLELSKNRFEKVDGLSFDGLAKLRVLKMKRNQVWYLNDGAFYGLDSLEELHLDRNRIQKVDKGWLYGQYTLRTLSLAHNEVDFITDDAWEYCSELTDLDLRSNRLQLLDRDSLRNLPQLRRLNLRDNHISHVSEAFSEVPMLEVLDLAGNEISYSVEDMRAPFGGLENLLELSLANNHIKAVGGQAFLDLTQLRSVDLRGNVISSLQEGALSPAPHLERLLLDSRSLLCDCHLRWLQAALAGANVTGAEGARCAHPEALKGRRVARVAQEDFTCEDFPKPYILKQPETQIALRGANVSLSCRAASTSPEEMSFSWRRRGTGGQQDSSVDDSELLSNLPPCSRGASEEPRLCVRTTAHSFDGKGREVTSELNLHHAGYEDAGRYQCVVANRFGSTYSEQANVTVYVFPTFLVTPVDVTVEGGRTAELRCAAKGVPAPKVSWSKDSGSDFPAASERRITVKAASEAYLDPSEAKANSFSIFPVKVKDMGEYTCTAENLAGRITWNITLNVLEAPRFLQPMERRVRVPVGGTAVLECLSSGSPKPQLSWRRDGRRFNATERHFFTADAQKLIIVEAEEADSGDYECHMSNRLGAQSQATRLDVQQEEPLSVRFRIVVALVCMLLCVCVACVAFLCHQRRRRRRGGPGCGRAAGSFAASRDATAEFGGKGLLQQHPGSAMRIGGSAGEGEFDIHEHVRRGLNRNHGPSSSEAMGSGTLRHPETGVLTTDLSLSTTQEEEMERDSGTGDSKKSSEDPRNREEGEEEEGVDEEKEEEEPLILGGGEGTLSLSEFGIPFADAGDDIDDGDYASDSDDSSPSNLQEGGGEGQCQWGGSVDEQIYQNLNRSQPEAQSLTKKSASPLPPQQQPETSFRTFHPKGRRQREISEVVDGHLRPSASEFNVCRKKRGSAVELNGECYLPIESPRGADVSEGPSLEQRVYRGGVGSLPRHGLEVQLELLEASLNSTAEERQEEKRQVTELDARRSASRSSLFGGSKKKAKRTPAARGGRDELNSTRDSFARKGKELFT